MFNSTDDGSVVDERGKVIYFSLDRFKRDICEGNCCFICGTSPTETTFNNEHVLPKWILRRFNLFDRTIGLPNDTNFRYDKYTIPCCESCNTQMGKIIETPISNLIERGYDAVREHLFQNGPWLFFVWFSLIFIKVHLKDKGLRMQQDLRLPDDRISDLYSWDDLHHIHCVARSFYTKCGYGSGVVGSIFLFPAKCILGFETFDYGDFFPAKTILLRLDGIAFICVLMDSCAACNLMLDLTKRFTGPLSPIQLREFMARAGASYLHLEQYPLFRSSFDKAEGIYAIEVDYPSQVAITDIDLSIYGAMLERACGHLVDAIETEQSEHIRGLMRGGRYTFLFEISGEFAKKSLEPSD